MAPSADRIAFFALSIGASRDESGSFAAKGEVEMSLVRDQEHRLELPESLRGQLLDFRRRVWSVKMAEAACAAAFVVALAFLSLFVLDRLWDTPAWPRAALFAVALAGCAAVPLA